ncbi:hypothetical protein [Streptomyces sp. RPT161]|uniref:hypothetical protein n=1 Tax=Streptomyces sp. RPT161 TaxID=3015993 RepID=UPI0022B906C2|nr:hypothetical protein [Streptomyces sp. RPT161]
MTLEALRRAMALVGARLRGDAEGERVLVGDCECGCRPLVEGLVVFGGVAVGLMAQHDQVTHAEAAERVAEILRSLPAGR